MSPGAGAAQTPTPAQATPVVSPQVAADRRVTFRLVAPGAMKAEVTALASSPTQGAISGRTLPMDARGDVWVAVSEPLAPVAARR